jgi:hypothetical protein
MTDTRPAPGSAAALPRVPYGYVLGVDLAAQQDYTALCVLQATQPAAAPGVVSATVLEYDVVHLERWRELPYPQTTARILERYRALRLVPHVRRLEPRILIDATGVGLPVLHMLREKLPAVAGVMIHGGEGETRDRATGVHRVPKRNLVAHMQVTLQTQRLRIARDLELSQTLAEELRGFRVEITKTGHDRYGNDVGDALWREQDHDDLVLATALAVWWFESGTNSPQIFV